MTQLSDSGLSTASNLVKMTLVAFVLSPLSGPCSDDATFLYCEPRGTRNVDI